MNRKRNVEIFSAGCPACEESIALVKRLACQSCEVGVHEMREAGVAARAKAYGIRSVPAVVIDGKLSLGDFTAFNLWRIAGGVAIVTGGSLGIGRAIALVLAREGVNVAVNVGV